MTTSSPQSPPMQPVTHKPELHTVAQSTRSTVRGDYLRPQTVNERVKHWFSAAGLVADGRPVSSHGLRAGAATDLSMNDTTDKEIAEAGRWRPDSPIPQLVYVRPAQAAKRDPFSKIPRHGTDVTTPSRSRGLEETQT
ncbi:hypothetical protein NLX86_33770 [Streptomyces sp. A3M-1-3]|uniref:hypothetical protein n=1 Tax=Streptomyces sp. A3M-1-3 TaxID=2962044 RepID=UPI0020B830D1|nr:hypothetical protein [Streptomyces sp. A3M-1-3]MCP3822865.1 hypothetical protein [Streptomyces sp. A3M-1-3]